MSSAILLFSTRGTVVPTDDIVGFGDEIRGAPETQVGERLTAGACCLDCPIGKSSPSAGIVSTSAFAFTCGAKPRQVQRQVGRRSDTDPSIPLAAARR